MELTSLKKIYNRCSEYVRYVDEGRWMEQRDDVSEFWADVFQIRRNYTKFNDMLVMRRGATHPLGDSESNIAPGVEYQKARAAYLVVSQSVPETYFGNLNESVIGSPMSFDFNGQMFSTGGIINALTSYRIVKWCKSKGLVNRPLRILEIGAGYGGVAYQLFQQLKIKSYTICDLPENLFLSAFYLQANFPDQKAIFVGENGAVQSEESKFIFLVPPFLNKLSGPFDLVINSYSFQEMNLASVNEYFAFVETKLETDGLFYSLNAHRKDEVAWPSDYPVEKFRMISLEPVRKYPHHYVFATNPYEVVMTKRTEPPCCAEALTRFKRQFDALGVALQLGLHDELLEMCQKFSQAELELEVSETDWLENLCDFLYVSDYTKKKDLLGKMRLTGILPMVVAYLAGSLEFAYGQLEQAQVYLEEAVGGAAASHAKVRSYIMLACLTYRTGARAAGHAYYSQAQSLIPHLSTEISHDVLDYDSLAGQVAYQLYLDLPRRPVDWRSLGTRVLRKLIQIRDQVSQWQVLSKGKH